MSEYPLHRLEHLIERNFVGTTAAPSVSEIKVIDRIPLLWSGWELDDAAWLVELPDGSYDILIENRTVMSGRVPRGGVGAVGKQPDAATGESLAASGCLSTAVVIVSLR